MSGWLYDCHKLWYVGTSIYTNLSSVYVPRSTNIVGQRHEAGAAYVMLFPDARSWRRGFDLAMEDEIDHEGILERNEINYLNN